MKKTVFFLFINLLVAQTFADPTSTEEKILAAVKPQMGKTQVGAMVGFIENGEVRYIEFGEKNKGKNNAPNERTLFEIGSLTKTFTSLLFSIAIGKQLVNTETTLGDIRPEWNNEELGKITLLELANHRSGLPRLPCDLHSSNPQNPYLDYNEKELINSIKQKVIVKYPKCKVDQNRPTYKVNYSNWGAALLGNAIAYAAQSTYGSILQRWITEPLGMTDTVIETTTEQQSRLAQGYNENLSTTSLWTRPALLGNGAILSTASDIRKYAQAMLNPETTSMGPAIRRVQEEHYDDGVYKMGIGWFLTKGHNIWHSGKTGGFSSFMKVHFSNKFAVFSLSNSANDLKCLVEATENIACDPLKK
jgi:CubicO group peptidase (beta-lactamase class C family)